MKNESYYRAAARLERGRIVAPMMALLVVAGLAGCTKLQQLSSALSPEATQAGTASVRPAAAPAPGQPFDKAVVQAADKLFASAASAEAGAAPGERQALVIDPLIDEATGFRSAATRSMESQIVDLVRTQHPQFEVRELTSETLSQEPLVLLGSLAGVPADGTSGGRPEVYRIWLVLADLKSGRIVAKGAARAASEGVDLTPAAFDRESPGWVRDRYVGGYLATCGGKIGDPIDPAYLEGIQTAAVVRAATDAYEAGRYEEALDLYTQASETSAGDQLRVHNGLYLANWQLGRRDRAAEAFSRLVDYGLRNDRLAIRFLFKPGTATFWPPELAKPYPMWLEQLAQRTANSSACLEVTGHTSPTGPTALNERLSLRRAEYIIYRLQGETPQLGSRMIANAMGSRENIVGTGRDDVTDAIDRRVEFRALPCGLEAHAAPARGLALASWLAG
jgi:outer membrane protein OmpA-like peptidoglycan-associated protein